MNLKERKKEFLAKWWDIFEKDCAVGYNQNLLSRTITESEVVKIGEHLFEWFQSYRLEISEQVLTVILLKTMRKYSSAQEWAEEIVKQLEKGGN